MKEPSNILDTVYLDLVVFAGYIHVKMHQATHNICVHIAHICDILLNITKVHQAKCKILSNH